MRTLNIDVSPVPQEELPLSLRQAIADQHMSPQEDEGNLNAEIQKFYNQLDSKG